MAQTEHCGPALLCLSLAFVVGGVTGSETYSFSLVVETMDYLAAVNSSIEDPSLDCVRGKRIDYNLTAETATYIQIPKGQNETGGGVVEYHYTWNSTVAPDKATVVIGNDSSNSVNITIGYTDYETCYVGILPLDGESQCMLWVQVENLDEIPQSCSDAFANICGSGFPLYGKAECGF